MRMMAASIDARHLHQFFVGESKEQFQGGHNFSKDF
jgi:hypothetical protein